MSEGDDNYPSLLNQLDILHLVPLRYEYEETRSLALSLVPVDELQARVEKLNPVTPEEGRDLLLVELLQWFKDDFFRWMDEPACDVCGEKGVIEKIIDGRQAVATAEEELALARHIELYECLTCDRELRFPRYNCPEKLLETREGRCGEWANAFTLICIALDYEARYVWDITDHVWTEVWSDAKNRWIHCDPCESAFDTPLLYEQGWGKKLSYVFAFTSFETVDVTWRYVTNFKETLSRRRMIDEKMLIEYQQVQNRQYQSDLYDEDVEFLKKRRVMELAEFLAPPKVRKFEELQGRQSGDLAWRLGRGEVQTHRIIRNLKPDVETMEIVYSCADDTYSVEEDGVVVETAQGWASLMHSNLNIMRKEERDWKMVYLARRPGSTSGRMEWQIELTKDCRSVEVTFVRETFENASVSVTLTAENGQKFSVADNEVAKFDLPAQESQKKFLLSCDLSGGQGSNAWQHAQAFRQPSRRRGDPASPSPTLRLKLFF